jgi:hypothetical protein
MDARYSTTTLTDYSLGRVSTGHWQASMTLLMDSTCKRESDNGAPLLVARVDPVVVATAVSDSVSVASAAY